MRIVLLPLLLLSTLCLTAQELLRTEAEATKLTNYTTTDDPTASAGAFIVREGGDNTVASLFYTYTGPAGDYDLNIRYLDRAGGTAFYTIIVDDFTTGQWGSDLTTVGPAVWRNFRVPSRPLEPGTTIEIQAGGDAADPPTIDFIGYSDPAPVDPYRIVQAEDFATERGTRPGASGLAVGFIEDGDYLLFNNVAIGAGPRAGTVFASSNTGGGTIEFRLNEPDGPLLATSTIERTRGWSDFDPFPIVIAEEFAAGGDFPAQTKLYLVFRGPDGFLFDVNSFYI